jgi:acetyl-CoA synthetase
VEFEIIVNAHPDVFESAAVSVIKPGEGAERLVVYIVCNRETDQTELLGELNKLIADKLNPLFKIYELHLIDKLPRTASNKIMRRLLRDRIK